MSFKISKTITIRVIITIFVLCGALILTLATRNLLVGKETAYRPPCLIEDCTVAIRSAGFPFRTATIERQSGLGCDMEDYQKGDCREYVSKGFIPYALNFVAYALALLAVVAISLKFLSRRKQVK